MSVVEAAVEVDATPEQVWQVVSDPRNLPRWDHHITSVEGVPARGLRAGTEYVTHVRFMGAKTRVTATVLELRGETYAKVALRGLMDGVVETWVEPLDGGRARLRHRIDYRLLGGPVGRLAGEALRVLGASAILKRGVNEQKRQAEEQAG